jgi:hypothetical protein
VGDLFMSLIHTCQLCGANSFHYLTELQRHAQKLATKPAEWMPWNYCETLARVVPLADSAQSYDESYMAGSHPLRPVGSGRGKGRKPGLSERKTR